MLTGHSCIYILSLLPVLQVLSETQQMVPDCHRRLVAARADLEKSIAELEPDFGGDPQKEEEPDENLVAAKQVRDHPYTTFGHRTS